MSPSLINEEFFLSLENSSPLYREPGINKMHSIRIKLKINQMIIAVYCRYMEMNNSKYSSVGLYSALFKAIVRYYRSQETIMFYLHLFSTHRESGYHQVQLRMFTIYHFDPSVIT